MRRTIKAFLLGYIRFYVNGKVFWIYGEALKAKNNVPKDEEVYFHGFNVFWAIRDTWVFKGIYERNGRRSFFLRCHNMDNITRSVELR